MDSTNEVKTFYATRLEMAPNEIQHSPEAAILRAARIFRDDRGNFLLLFKHSYHASKIAESLSFVKILIAYIYHIPTNEEFRVEIAVGLRPLPE